MPERRRKKREREPNFLEQNDEYHIMYYQLIKDSKFWSSNGQYWLAQETYKRALSILNGNIDECNKPVRTEKLYYDKHSGSIGGVR